MRAKRASDDNDGDRVQWWRVLLAERLQSGVLDFDLRHRLWRPGRAARRQPLATAVPARFRPDRRGSDPGRLAYRPARRISLAIGCRRERAKSWRDRR